MDAFDLEERGLMTPEELVQQVVALVAAHRDREALDLTHRILRDLAPSMTSGQIVQVADFAHMAQMAVDLEACDVDHGSAESGAHVARRA